MTVSDAVGSTFGVAFGLWWVFLPNSVIRFYTWFHRSAVQLPPTKGVRLAGLVWLLIIGVVLWRALVR